MFRSTLFALALALGFTGLATGALAGPAQSNEQIKQTIAKNLLHLSPNLKVESVRPLKSIPGLYEVRVGHSIFYTDASGEHMISGHIFSTVSRTDLTEARLEEVNRIDWKQLPLKNAIVSGDPKGKPVAIFTDPDCPFCRRLEHELPKVKGIKIYTFLFPLVAIHHQSRAKAEAIWCSKNREKALLDVMIDNKQASELDAGSCKTPIDENLALGAKLGINGTPTLIAGDGRKHAGGMSAAQLEAWAAK